MLGVVALSELAGDRHVPQGHDREALALEASNDLAAQRSGEGVRLYEDQRAVHWVLFGSWVSGGGARTTARAASASGAPGSGRRLGGRDGLGGTRLRSIFAQSRNPPLSGGGVL